MSPGRWTPKLVDILVVMFLLASGFVAGSYTSTQFEDSTNQSSVVTQDFPESELRQVSAESNSNFIQAPYAEVNSTLKEASVEVDISAVAFPEGKSMRPTIFSDNMVLMEKYRDGEIKEGQIIRYSSEEGHVIHRVQANYLDTSGYLLVRGDNNDYSTRVKPDQITHRVIGVIYTSENPTSG